MDSMLSAGRMKHLIVSLMTVALLGSVFAGCAVNPVTGKNELMFITEEGEIEMGRTTYPNALWGAEGGGGEYRDENARQYLEGVIGSLHRVSHRPNLPVSFAIQNSSVPNAWAIPGYVTMTRGLLSSLDNEAEFAFVMGHEMGHVSARHSARHQTYGLLQQLGLGLTAALVSNQKYGELALGLGAISSQLLLLKYSRDDELEADGLGVEYMKRLGYNPRYAVNAHRNLEKAANEYVRSVGQEPGEANFFQELMSTHPRTQVRIDEIQQIINNSPPSPALPRGENRDRFQNMTASVRKANRVYTDYYDKAVRAYQKDSLTEANNLLNRAITADPNQPPFYALAGFVYMKSNKYSEAEKYFNGALKLNGDYQPAIRGLGMLQYQKNNLYEAERYFKRAISLYPEDIPSNYYLGMGYYKKNNYREAIPYLGKVADASPRHPSIHGILGLCYEKNSQLTNAYQQFQLQMQVDPDSETGRYATSRVNALKPTMEKPKETPKK